MLSAGKLLFCTGKLCPVNSPQGSIFWLGATTYSPQCVYKASLLSKTLHTLWGVKGSHFEVLGGEVFGLLRVLSHLLTTYKVFWRLLYIFFAWLVLLEGIRRRRAYSTDFAGRARLDPLWWERNFRWSVKLGCLVLSIFNPESPNCILFATAIVTPIQYSIHPESGHHNPQKGTDNQKFQQIRLPDLFPSKTIFDWDTQQIDAPDDALALADT